MEKDGVQIVEAKARQDGMFDRGGNKDIRRINIPTLCIDGISLETCETVGDLGILLNCNFSMKEQIRVVRTTRYHIRNIGSVRKYLNVTTTKMLVHNYVLANLTIIIATCHEQSSQTDKRSTPPPGKRITPSLIDLHWLPVKARTEYKIAAMSHQALLSGKPQYLRNTLKGFHRDTTMELRHDTDLHRLLEPRSNSNMGFRAFERCAPRIYNKLANDIKYCAKMDVFKKKLFGPRSLRPQQYGS